MSDPLIETANLSRSFWIAEHRRGAFGALRGLVDRGRREVKAVDGVSFSIERGEIVGFIGPNGAGKSTTIKMLTGILVPTSGAATVDGLIPWHDRKILARRMGVVFGQRTQLWWDLPLIESLELLRFVYRVPTDRFQQNMTTLRDLLDLDPFLATPVRQLSLGQRMRGDLAAAVLHDPPLLYLDEPTIGLDLVAKARVREFLAEINRERGVTILMTTHDLADIEALCRRMLVIDRGQVLYDGDIDQLRDRYGQYRTLVVDVEGNTSVSADPIAGATLVRTDGPRLWLRFNRHQTSAADLIAAVAARQPIRDVAIEEPSIEEVVKQMYAAGIRTGPAANGTPPAASSGQSGASGREPAGAVP